MGTRFTERGSHASLGAGDTHVTTSQAKQAGSDYVPTPPFYLFGPHLSAIAAAGPIVRAKDQLAFVVTLGATAFSTFVFDTLDVATRLGRYIIQELFGLRGVAGATVATLATMAAPMYFLAFTPSGAWLRFWTLFGASNQLLAAPTLLAITVWLAQARRRIAFTLLLMAFVLTMVRWALTKITFSIWHLSQGLDADALVALTAIALMLLAPFVVGVAIKRFMEERSAVQNETVIQTAV